MENWNGFRAAGELFGRILQGFRFGTLSMRFEEPATVRIVCAFIGRLDQPYEIVESFDLSALESLDSSAVPGLSSRTIDQFENAIKDKRNVNVIRQRPS